MKRTTDQVAKNDDKKRNSSTPKNPQKKHKSDDSENKAKRQIDFKQADKKNDSSLSSIPDKPKVSISNPRNHKIKLKIYLINFWLTMKDRSDPS